jgi:molybdopterin molybdotransferase
MLTDSALPQSNLSCADDREPDVLSVDEARQHIMQEISPISAAQKVAIRSALGRILAEDVTSPVNVPSHTNSAMDGYALKGTDLVKGVNVLDCIGIAYAGKPFKGETHTEQCVRIMTGAPTPAGTDTVVMQEQTEILTDGKIRILGKHRTGQNVRQAGEDIACGSVILKQGHQILPADLGVLASLGIGELSVRRRPRVAFFSTGDELRSLGEVLREGEIYDSNRYSLYGMLTRLELEILDLGVIPDQPAAVRDAFAMATTMADVVITSGGVSVGEADYVKQVLDEFGQIEFWKIAMKPGRPLTFGHLGDSLFFGLPGNPVAVMVTFYQFVQPAIRYLAGGKPHLPFTLHASCTHSLHKRRGRTEFLRGVLQQTRQGELQVTVTGRQGSGILSSMSRSNCFIVLPENSADVEIGSLVAVQPFACFV